MVGTGFWGYDAPTQDDRSGGPELNDNPQSLDTDKYLPGPESVSEVSKDESEGETAPEPVEEPQEPSQPQEERPDPNVVRAWAKENNVEVSAKGRVAQQVYDQYAEAHKN